MTEFLDPDHEAMGDAAGDLIDPDVGAAADTGAIDPVDADWDPRPPATVDLERHPDRTGGVG